MKKTNVIFAIIALAIVAVSIAVVSCKKETGDNLRFQENNNQRVFNYRQIEDKRAYFADFKKKLSECKDNEAFSFEDAGWHLACLANLDFCNVNVYYTDLQFDTIEMTVNVTDSVVMLSDLRVGYEQMCTLIQQFKNRFYQCDQNMYYVNVAMDVSGYAKIAITTSFTSVSKSIYDHAWYFYDEFTALYECENYFDLDSTYQWNTRAADLLQNVLNLFEHHENTIGEDGAISICYTPTRNHTFDYSNTIDPYHSDFYNDSRVFAMRKNSANWNFFLSFDQMCYCLDSYLGLGYDYVDNTLYPNEHPVCWKVFRVNYSPNPTSYYYYHQLYVEYGQLVTNHEWPIVD